jgi:hypothetical protein
MVALARPKSKPGFSWLKNSNPKLYRQFKDFIERGLDKFDWGFLSPLNQKPRVNKNESLAHWLNTDIPAHEKDHPAAPKRPKALSLARLERAAAGEITYVCSHPMTGLGMLVFDIDDKDGSAGDAWGVNEFLRSLVLYQTDSDGKTADLFSQPSTFGKGVHGYFFIKYDSWQVGELRDLCVEFEKVMTGVLRDHGFQSTFELKGKPGLLRANGTYQVRSDDLIKFPILQDEAEIDQFVNRTLWLSLNNLRAIISLFSDPVLESVPTNTIRGRGGDPVADVPLFLSAVEAEAQWGKPKASKRKQKAPYIALVGTNHGEPDWGTVKTLPPHKRMGVVGRWLSRCLNRPAEWQEILSDYEARGMNTEEDDDGNRKILAQKVAAWIKENWKSSPQKKHTFNDQHYLPLILKHVTPSHRENIYQKNRSAFTDNELAVVLHVIELNATTVHPDPRKQFGCPNGSFLAMFEVLGEPLEGEGDAQRKKLAAMKQLLVAADLACIVDEKYIFGNGNGRGKKFGLGKFHPRYSEFLALK